MPNQFGSVGGIRIDVNENSIRIPMYHINLRTIINIMELASHWPAFDTETRGFAKEVARFYQKVEAEGI
jgi:hypothetical protein